MKDKDGYPDKASLKRIREWDIWKQGIVELLDLITENTQWADRQIRLITGEGVILFEYHTGGWSGNEDVISVLAQTTFWFMFWQKSIRGGHYYFEIEHPEWYGKLKQEVPK